MAKINFRTWSNKIKDLGEENKEKSNTMPEMHTDPRKILENHVKGINPITGAILDNQKYYGDNILEMGKDLTFEELRIKREALESQQSALESELAALQAQQQEAAQTESQTEETPSAE
jgi:hypothetical protein